MSSRTPLFSKGILANDLRRFSWLGIIYTLGLIFSLPLQLFLCSNDLERNFRNIKNLLVFDTQPLQVMLLLVIPILLAIFLFRYMQAKNSNDFIHSLPVKRGVYYRSHLLAGVVILIIPVVITGILALFLRLGLGLAQYFTVQDVFLWMGHFFLFEMLFFMISVLAGIVAGISTLQGVLSIILLLLPAGLIALITENLRVLIYGYTFNLSINTVIFSPIIRILEGQYIPFSFAEFVSYVVIIVFAYFLGEFLYRKRKLENAGQAIVFDSLSILFKYGMTFCFMLLGGLYFWHSTENVAVLFIAYLLSSLFGYYLAKIILHKNFWVFKEIKGYLCFALTIGIILVGINLDIIGFEKKIPDVSKIDSVYMGYGFNRVDAHSKERDVYYNEENIENIVKLHEGIKENKRGQNLENTRDKGELVFIYTLKDGSKLTRGYTISEAAYAQYFKPIYESLEYKKMRYDFLDLNSSDIQKLTISPELSVGKQAEIIKGEEIAEAVKILKEEINAMSYEEMNDPKASYGRISTLISGDKVAQYQLRWGYQQGNISETSVVWKRSYKRFEEWLATKGYLEDAKTSPEDIGYIVVREEEKRRGNVAMSEYKNDEGISISDQAQIKFCLENYGYYRDLEQISYRLEFYSKDKVFLGDGYFYLDDTPEFIKKHFDSQQ